MSGSRRVSGNQPVFLVLGILSSESNSPATHRIPNPSPMRLVSYMWVVGLKKSFPRWGGGGAGAGAGAGHDPVAVVVVVSVGTGDPSPDLTSHIIAFLKLLLPLKKKKLDRPFSTGEHHPAHPILARPVFWTKPDWFTIYIYIL
ncbi:hypothetical protein SAY86_008799 [Trapa natans]|uniref:Uncharacterized protein n=1 Tax=Trapa natans TaxID=22666 RepID=A0AAN7KA45_TRANT|nr:hypothetical protein SAY86_008799 [Trapa natans]